MNRIYEAHKGWLVWFKGQTGLTMSDAELAYTNMDKPLRCLTLNRGVLAKQNTSHPTQKPIELMEWCLSFVPDAKTVCDPFMGSGTTGVACARKGLTFVGIEREEKYFDIACKRIEEAYRTRPRLFDVVKEPKQAVQMSLV